jgi:Tol biopolymer transport system component
VANGSGRYDLRLYSVSTGQMLAEIANASQPRFNEAGNQLAVKAQQDNTDTIWIYDADGQNPRQASPGQGNSHPAWTSDGQQMVYENRNVPKDGQSVWRIFIQEVLLSPTSADIDQLAGDIFDADRPLYPLWTPDGDIIFSACNYWSNGGQCGVWRTSSLATVPDSDTDVDRGFLQPESITRDQEFPTDVEGSRLLVTGGNDRNWELYLGDIAGGSLQNLSTNPASDGLGVFSPDGRWIAFVSNRDDNWGVWVIPSTGGQATRLPFTGLQFATGERNWTTERIAWGP